MERTTLDAAEPFGHAAAVGIEAGSPARITARVRSRLRPVWPIAVFLAMAAAHVVATRHLLHAYPYSWSWTELLVDYQGGFVKRGLLGEAAFRLQDVVSPGRFIVYAVCAAYLVASAGLVFALRLPEHFPGLLFLASPAGWAFPLLNPAAYGRKDAFVLAALVSSLAIVRRVKSGALALGATMAIFAVAGLVVEIAWFYYPAVVVAAIMLRGKTSRWRLRAAGAGCAYTLACLIATLLSAPVSTAGIAASWHGIPYPTTSTGALCCLNFKLSDALGTARATLPNLPGYALALALGALPLALSVARRPPARADATTWAAVAVALACALAPVALTADWGRYIYLWCTTAFVMSWTLPRQTASATAPSHAETASDLVCKTALLLLYASTWQVLHYQFPDRSALVPGFLFRAFGSTGTLPLQN